MERMVDSTLAAATAAAYDCRDRGVIVLVLMVEAPSCSQKNAFLLFRGTPAPTANIATQIFFQAKVYQHEIQFKDEIILGSRNFGKGDLLKKRKMQYSCDVPQSNNGI
uniref:Uncharacterized protein n=1 Tax=Physcomitrium patens TaxID=3218 RepID=A0A2K1KAJ4_PHYPA|nr:hypothetical protein PHYPA_009987 [Physcomitrium patens]